MGNDKRVKDTLKDMRYFMNEIVITVEGVPGVGKSTVAMFLANTLSSIGFDTTVKDDVRIGNKWRGVICQLNCRVTIQTAQVPKSWTPESAKKRLKKLTKKL